MIVDPGCEQACAECIGWCDGVGGWCHDAECARDADAVGCMPGQRVTTTAVTWFKDGALVERDVEVCE